MKLLCRIEIYLDNRTIIHDKNAFIFIQQTLFISDTIISKERNLGN